MAYDPNLDEVLVDFGVILSGNQFDIVAKIVSYNKSESKLSINRVGQTKAGKEFTRSLGRITHDELEAVIKFADIAKRLLDDYSDDSLRHAAKAGKIDWRTYE
jgi:hypothetical protein